MNDMNRCCAIAAILMMVCGGMSMTPARAVPPTVTPSPGYDARLQEQHAALGAHRPPAPALRHRVRRTRHDTHLSMLMPGVGRVGYRWFGLSCLIGAVAHFRGPSATALGPRYDANCAPTVGDRLRTPSPHQRAA